MNRRLLIFVLISLAGLVCAIWLYSMRAIESRTDNSSTATESDVSAQMKRVTMSKDPIAMYDLGVVALKNHDLLEAYVWYTLSSEYITKWAVEANNKKGEERFDENYLVMDIFKVQNDVNTNATLIHNQLSKEQKIQAEIILQRRRQEFNAPRLP